jgi:alcohol dehydrogenase (cytochrome c)
MNITRWLAAGAALASLAAPPVLAQTAAALKADAATPGDVLTYGMGYNNQRYSPLKQINSKNAAKLQPAWTYSLNNPQGQESHPIIHEG